MTRRPRHPGPPVTHRVLTPPQHYPPPRGWTADADRAEEYADLSWLTVLSKNGEAE